MSTLRKILLAGAFVTGMVPSSGNAQGFFFGLISVQTPTIYGEHSSGSISRQQALDIFSAMDANGDRFVSKQEFENSYPDYFSDDSAGKLTEKRYRALDKTKAGKISKADFVANRNAVVD